MLYLNGVLQITQLCQFENLNTELQNIFNNFNLPVDLNDPELKSNETVKKHVSEEKLKHFTEVTDIINELILEKKIFNNSENTTDQKK
mgnify:CR=1 FL=1